MQTSKKTGLERGRHTSYKKAPHAGGQTGKPDRKVVQGQDGMQLEAGGRKRAAGRFAVIGKYSCQ